MPMVKYCILQSDLAFDISGAATIMSDVPADREGLSRALGNFLCYVQAGLFALLDGATRCAAEIYTTIQD